MGDEDTHPEKITTARITQRTKEKIALHQFDGENVNDAIERITDIAPDKLDFEQGCAVCDDPVVRPGEDPTKATFIAHRLSTVDGLTTATLYCTPGCFIHNYNQMVEGSGRNATKVVLTDADDTWETRLRGEWEFTRDGFAWEVARDSTESPGLRGQEHFEHFVGGTIEAYEGKRIIDRGELVAADETEDGEIVLAAEPEGMEPADIDHIHGNLFDKISDVDFEPPDRYGPKEGEQ